MWYVYENKNGRNIIICRCRDKISAEMTAQILMFGESRRRIGIVSVDNCVIVQD